MTTERRPGAKEDARPPAREHDAEVVEEARVAGSPATEGVNGMLLALSRAARSFQLYDANNATIRHFIEDLRVKTKRALDTLGALDLEVRPYELLHSGEVVYVEQERERSLAFRLFRDGVRRLQLSAEVRWEEVLRLLEILSIRYAGVRQNEDDVVTLLRKAGFKSIAFEVVEGFVPAEDEAGPVSSGSVVSAGAAHSVPADWDLPVRDLAGRAELAWCAVDETAHAALAAEEAEEQLPQNAVAAVRTLLELRVGELSAAAELHEFTPFIGEVRDFLLAEGYIGELVVLVRSFYESMRMSPAFYAPILRSFAEKSVLRRLILAVAPVSQSPSAEMIELLDLVPADHLATVVDLLDEDFDEAGRRIMRQLVERYAPERPDYLLSRLRDAPPRVACDLLRACARALPDRAVDAALELAGHADAAVVHEALRRFEKAPSSPRVGRTLAQLLASSHEDVRLRALDLLSRRGERAAFAAIVEHAERQAGALSEREAELTGRTLARLSPEAALTVFQGWAHPKPAATRRGETGATRRLEWAAVAGLGLLDAPEAATLLREIGARADEELRRHVHATLTRRRDHKEDSDG